MDKKCWLFAVRVHDRPGTLTGVSSVFSNRGVSIQMLLGSTLEVVAPNSIPLFFVFEATEQRKDLLLRAMGRLASVISLQCYDYDSPCLRAVAFAHVDPRKVPRQETVPSLAAEESVSFAPIDCEDAHETWVLIASPAQVEHCLQRLRRCDALLRTTMTIIPVD